MNFINFHSFIDYFQVNKILESENFHKATTHPSINKRICYERLEFLGDSVLNFAISSLLFLRFTEDSEGDLSKKKSILASRDVAFKIGLDIKLQEEIKVAKNLQHNLKDNLNIISAVVESILAIIYIEYGFDKVHEIVESLFFKYLDESNDTKTKLQEFTQSKFKKLPVYKIIAKTGTDNKPKFQVSVEIEDFIAFGEGSKINLAEKEASNELYKILTKYARRD